MKLLWAALPMAGCAVMMVVMMRMMAGRHRNQPGSETDSAERRARLEAEVEDLRSQADQKNPS